MIQPTDFGTCPECHRTDESFYPESIEIIRGYAGINLVRDNSRYEAHFDGQTVVDWDSSSTVGYQCGSCKTILPERHLLYLDHLLGRPRISR